MPEGFDGVDVANACDSGLVEEQFFQRTARGGQEFCEVSRRESWREGIDTEGFDRGSGVGGFVRVDAAEMAAVGESEDAFVEFEGTSTWTLPAGFLPDGSEA
jgi:hypothetical protein